MLSFVVFLKRKKNEEKPLEKCNWLEFEIKIRFTKILFKILFVSFPHFWK